MNDTIHDIFISGKKINLTVLTSEQIEHSNWYRWMNCEEVTKYMQKHYYPNTKKNQLNFFENEIENNQSKVQLGITHIEDNKLIGTISLNNIDFINRQCEISGLIGEKKYQRLSYFIEASKLILEHAFNTLNLQRVYSASIKKEIDELFCKILHFRHEGILKKSVYKNGKYYDVYQHAILRSEYYNSINEGQKSTKCESMMT